MKKLIISTLVVALASLAPATINISGTGTITLTIDTAPSISGLDTIMHGDTVTMSLVSDGGWQFEGSIWLDYSTYNAAGDTLSNIVVINDPPIIIPPFPDPYLPDGFAFSIVGGLGNPTPSGTLLTFDLTNTGTPIGGFIKLDMLDSSFGILGATLIEVVPEPMTLGLLGLGAMFLRRRK